MEKSSLKLISLITTTNFANKYSFIKLHSLLNYLITKIRFLPLNKLKQNTGRNQHSNHAFLNAKFNNAATLVISSVVRLLPDGRQSPCSNNLSAVPSP